MFNQRILINQIYKKSKSVTKCHEVVTKCNRLKSDLFITFIPMEELLNKLIEKGWKPRGKYEMEYQYML